MSYCRVSGHGTSCELNNHGDFYDLCFHSQRYNVTHSFTLSTYLSLLHINTHTRTYTHAHTHTKKIEPPSQSPKADKIVSYFGNLFKDEPLPKDGYVELTDKPGFGVELNREELNLRRPYPRD